MLSFAIADLFLNEIDFTVPSRFGVWEFERFNEYHEIKKNIQPGQCATTFTATNSEVTPRVSHSEFDETIHDLLDICLFFSYCTGKCVTPRKNTLGSDIKYIEFGDNFLLSKNIEGINPININSQYGVVLKDIIISNTCQVDINQFRLLVTYWLNGITCFSLEDLFLGLCVVMDIVKQCEKTFHRRNFSFFEGMQAASTRFNINELSRDYTKMRNDLVHEGKLSGNNYNDKTKTECAETIVQVLNWLDFYFAKILGIENHFTLGNRFSHHDIIGLPSFSLVQ